MSKKTRNKSNSSISLANHRKQQQQQQSNKKQTNRNTTNTHSTHNPKPPKPTINKPPPLNHDYYDDDKVIKPENVIYLDEAAQNEDEDDNVDASSDENVDYSSAEQDVDGLRRNDAFSSSIVDLNLSSSSYSSLYFRPYSNLYFPFFIFTIGRYLLL